ncbi:ABC transporter ATP-binding protein [Nonomuraea sp. NPDC050404]|uniref:ABC transporter ATP-binding protein n=1 Tax=Nonomuraea sp. NPDC050404 TaxID=3155783 RepID=UPI0033C420DB
MPGRSALQLLLACVCGVLPALFGALVGLIVGTLPETVRAGGLDTASGERLVALLVAAVVLLVVQELANSAYEVARWAFYRRYEHYLLGRVIDATLGTRRLELFEDPRLSRLADRSVRLAGLDPGDLVDGWCTRWLHLCQGAAAAALVATVWPVAAGVLVVVWSVAGAVMLTALRRLDIDSWSAGLLEAEYLGRIAEKPAWAKEVRVFGLTGWLAERFGLRWTHALEQLARARRVGRWRTALVLLALLCSHGVIVGVMVSEGLSATQLTVLLLGMSGMAALADQSGAELIEYGSPRVSLVLDLEKETANVAANPPSEVAASPRPEVAANPRPEVAANPRPEVAASPPPEVAAGPLSRAGRPGPSRSSSPVRISREIRFSDVRFAYPNAGPVFRRLNLAIEAGTSLGVVGLNGAGKTTLIKLLTGLEVPEAGNVTVDGVPVGELDAGAWRRTIAAIFQDFVHYELPARDNIGFGAVEALHVAHLDAVVSAAAERAGAQDLIARLPDGLGTTLSRRFPGGVDLSGGQWQRIALARAMAAVHNGAGLLILDEPTAQLDVRAEADLYDRFLDLTRDLTTIIISHRFSTVRRADRIVVLDRGEIVEDGSHDELLAAGGEYARLFAIQAASYLDDGIAT